ncbi:MAG: plastocyanin/azurin family copper-binding protein [Gemmatimonadota bacterium]
MTRSRFSLLLAVPAAALLAGCNSSTQPNGGIMVPHGNITIRNGGSALGANAFAPPTLTVSLATASRVVWSNGDVGSGAYPTGTTHHILSNNGTFESADLGPGRTYAFTFADTGHFAYHCAIHPSMVGTVVVTP